MGGLLASLVPRSRIVPAVKPEDMSQDPAVVGFFNLYPALLMPWFPWAYHMQTQLALLLADCGCILCLLGAAIACLLIIGQSICASLWAMVIAHILCNIHVQYSCA